ncbi:hypothetical protein [Cupriavidus metallidurans]|uniref:hypothetical protein n=1 Tax=Cupriavidus metallidurans TaxID=119219 RepID=UPI00055FC93C|nr:hypothetical protein [Cupriavidus metallidurans]
MTEEEYVTLLGQAVEAAQGAIAECERLRQENHRLRLAIGLSRYKKPAKRAGRPPKETGEIDIWFGLVDLYKIHILKTKGRRVSDKDALATVMEAIYRSRGETYRPKGVREQQELKTLQNKLPAYRKRLQE